MKIQIKGINGGKDRRGLITLTYKFLFTESSEEEALTSSLPVKIQLPEVGRKIVEWVDHSSFLIDATYEGITAEPPASEEQFSILGEWREEPIEAFPDRKTLVSKYGAYEEDGRLKFPQYLGRQNSKNASFGNSQAQEIENPMFGITTFPVQMLVASHSYIRASVPPGVYEKHGTITKSLPAGFSNPPRNRTWIYEPCNVRKRGNAWEINEKLKEVNSLKHIEALYLILQKKSR